jgi:hypothetical protein
VVYVKFIALRLKVAFMRRLLALLANLVFVVPASAAWAGDVVCPVVGIGNKPVADAVVAACPPGQKGAAVRVPNRGRVRIDAPDRRGSR